MVSHATVVWLFCEENKSLCIMHACVCGHYFNIDNESLALLTLSLPAAVVQLNSAFYHVTSAYMCRRKDISQRTVTVPVFSGAIRPSLIGTTFLTELWLQSNGEKTFTCRF